MMDLKRACEMSPSSFYFELSTKTILASIEFPHLLQHWFETTFHLYV